MFSVDQVYLTKSKLDLVVIDDDNEGLFDDGGDEGEGIFKAVSNNLKLSYRSFTLLIDQ